MHMINTVYSFVDFTVAVFLSGLSFTFSESKW